MRKLTRLEPQLPAGAMKTYQVIAPVETHYRRATCAEVECGHYINGWRTPIDESTDLGKRQAYYLRNNSGRHFTEDRNLMPGLTMFTFEAGQTCFSAHQVRLDKPEVYLVKGGDWRGNPAGTKSKQHANAADWVEDFSKHQDALKTRLNQG